MGVLSAVRVSPRYFIILIFTAILLMVYMSQFTTTKRPAAFNIQGLSKTPSKTSNQTNAKETLIAHINSSAIDLAQDVLVKFIYETGFEDANSKLCPELGKNVQLVIIITSAPSHKRARVAIRQTWGSFGARKDVIIAFMLGSIINTADNILNNERNKYKDMICAKFIDTYENLTLKTISMLEWVDNYCPKAAFVLKTDDDVFINVQKLLTFTSNNSLDAQTIYGRLASKWKPVRDTPSKYYLTHQQFKPAMFPDFTTGPAYLFSARLAKALYTAAIEHTFFKLEDVFITGIVAENLNIKRSNIPQFHNKRLPFTPCNLQNFISIHKIAPHEQFRLWQMLANAPTQCK